MKVGPGLMDSSYCFRVPHTQDVVIEIIYRYVSLCSL